MAVEMFLDIDGVQGESQIKGFENKIDIFSYSLGASNPTSVATGSGSGAGKVDISSMSIQKIVDKATATLFDACCMGTHFDKGTLTVREAGGNAPINYLVMDFTQIFIDSVSWGGAAGGGKPSESVSFSFASINITYLIQTATGDSQAGGSAFWNLQKNTKDAS
ncbi:MAG TPA: type VI secretion system tube protein Hcp [Bryobacteraceae bacterium]|jgi:type VI secretion system secreted protein Hcp